MPEIIPRDEYGGRYQGRGLMTLPVEIIHAHHSVTNETIGVRATEDAKADFKRLDEEGKFGGIAYSYAGHPEGMVGEGQGLFIGTHTAEWNGFPWDRGTSFGYCFVGDFHPREGVDADQLTPEAIDGFRYWRDIMLYIGALAPAYVIRGHRDAPGNSTACPGDNIEENLGVLFDPYTPIKPRGDGDMDVAIHGDGRAWATQAGIVVHTYSGELIPDGYGNVLCKEAADAISAQGLHNFPVTDDDLRALYLRSIAATK